MTNDIVTYGNGETENLSERYSTAIQVWQIEHSCIAMDLTSAQAERFSAFVVSRDVAMARWLINQRRSVKVRP